jgi:uncharacterized protein YcbX
MEISQLFIYPVKSLKGIAVTESTLTPLGLEYDRHWMIINPDNKFVTQRKHANMVLVKTRMCATHLHFSKDGMPEIAIPLKLQANDQESFSAVIWNDVCEVIDEGEAISEWITEALESKKTLRLVKMAPQQKRPQSKPERFGEENTTQFSDAVSYLLCNQASLDELNLNLVKRGFTECTIERFRPNIVIQNSESKMLAFKEHDTQSFTHSSPERSYQFLSHDACQRCIVPTIDIETAEKHPQQEPYKTLVDLNPMPDNAKAPAFGQNLTLGDNSYGEVIKVGDKLLIK